MPAIFRATCDQAETGTTRRVTPRPMIIGQLARRTGVPIKALREYERLGLV
ncbi:MAG: MerR family DNA-binding transcriptional regulator, partial [Chloroflexi bacterium]|nr:MerR family DNA-binding transcriptional regulator [Chloroflexota bacterium]